MASADLLRIDALGPNGAYRTRNREVVTSTAGVAVVDLSIAPPLYVSRTISTQRDTRPLPAEQREAALAKAADAFATGVIAGLDFDTYVELASRISGVPIAVTRSGARGVADGVASAFGVVQLARPTGAVLDWRDERTRDGAAVWVRRGEVFAVLASGNGPGVHGLWPQALALGYRVAVRPSRREPLTAHRLVHALREAGFRPQDAVYLPTDHRGADEIIRSADLAMVYGSQDVVDLYANDPTVLVNGPGRAKILITADQDWRDYLDVITDSIANLGGIACVNTTAVLYEGDPTPLADAIGERLSAIPVLPTEDERAILPTQNIDQATALAALSGDRGRRDHAGARRRSGGRRAQRRLRRTAPGRAPDGQARRRQAQRRAAVSVRLGLAVVALRRSGPAAAFVGDQRDHQDDEDLIDDLLAEPTIANVYRGHHPTYYGEPEIPHDGFLPDFLMRNKGFIRD